MTIISCLSQILSVHPLGPDLLSWSLDDEIALRHPPSPLSFPSEFSALSLVLLKCSELPCPHWEGLTPYGAGPEATDHVNRFLGVGTMAFQLQVLEESLRDTAHVPLISLLSLPVCSLFVAPAISLFPQRLTAEEPSNVSIS